MKGTIERWLRGSPVMLKLMLMPALTAALAFASVGCIAEQGDSESDESEVEALDEEDVASVEQQLDPVANKSDSPAQEQGGIVLPGADAMIGEEGTDPQPQPWRSAGNEDDEDGDPSPSPAPDPFSHIVMSSPSGGHHLD